MCKRAQAHRVQTGHAATWFWEERNRCFPKGSCTRRNRKNACMIHEFNTKWTLLQGRKGKFVIKSFRIKKPFTVLWGFKRLKYFIGHCSYAEIDRTTCRQCIVRSFRSTANYVNVCYTRPWFHYTTSKRLYHFPSGTRRGTQGSRRADGWWGCHGLLMQRFRAKKNCMQRASFTNLSKVKSSNIKITRLISQTSKREDTNISLQHLSLFWSTWPSTSEWQLHYKNLTYFYQHLQ